MASFYVRVRSYDDANPAVSVWIIRNNGMTESGYLYGEVLPDSAEDLIKALKLPVKREHLKGMARISDIIQRKVVKRVHIKSRAKG